LSGLLPLAQEEGREVIVKHSASGYPETAQALADALDQRGLTLFAWIDHAGAAPAGMEAAVGGAS
jgi:hypothetical protein